MKTERKKLHGAAVEDDAVLLVVAGVGGDVLDAGGQFREPKVVHRPGKIKKTHINKLEIKETKNTKSVGFLARKGQLPSLFLKNIFIQVFSKFHRILAVLKKNTFFG